MNLSDKRIIFFAVAWFCISLIQAFFTEIIEDEAYYWVYSQALDWGYFDHPPMIAFLIKLGGMIFPGELGVRLMPSLLGAGTIFLVFTMLKDEIRDLRLAMLLAFSIPILHFHVAGFIATPDLPLVFFATLFFFLYKKYLSKATPWIIILLSLSVALMMYSKYHALLIVGFTVLSNLKLLGKRSFWIIVALSVLLFLPHIIWQVKHDFVSFGYHLVGRNSAFEFSYLLNYLLSQVMIIGPFLAFILLYLGIKHRPENKFSSALKINFIGFFLFFMISSLKGHVQAHWTAAALIPLMLLSFPMIDKSLRLRKWGYILSFITIPFVIFLSISLIIDLNIMPEQLSHRFLNKESSYKQIQKEADGRPVVFTNSYQKASLYWFFSGEPAFSQNNKHYRKNQYDLNVMEAGLHGKEVLYFPTLGFPECDTMKTNTGDFIYFESDYFCHFNRVEIDLPDIEWDFAAGNEYTIDLTLCNPTSDTIFFKSPGILNPWLVYSCFSDKGAHYAYAVRADKPLPLLPPETELVYPVSIKAPKEPGSYKLMFSFGSMYLPAGLNGNMVKMNVHSRSIQDSNLNK
jgi:hypothetical protein